MGQGSKRRSRIFWRCSGEEEREAIGGRDMVVVGWGEASWDGWVGERMILEVLADFRDVEELSGVVVGRWEAVKASLSGEMWDRQVPADELNAGGEVSLRHG